MDEFGPANDERERLDRDTVRLTEQARAAREKADQAQPLVDRRIRELTRLLEVPGVVDAVFADGRPDISTLLADVAARLAMVKR